MTWPHCPCERCNPQTSMFRRFTMCPDCGNKRCPKGTDHDLDCTDSNEPGQPGSSWEGFVIIDDVPTGDGRMSPEALERMAEWFRLQVEAGNVGIGTLRLPEGDLLKSLLDSTDTEA